MTTTKQNSKQTLFFLLFFIALGTQLQAQKFADKDFYLVDSLVLEDLDEYDKNVLDSMLTIYNSSNDDTTELNCLLYLCDEIYQKNVFLRYSNLIHQKVLFGLAQDDLTRAEKYFYKNALAEYYNLEGFVQTLLYSRSDSAIYFFKKALDKFVEIKNLNGMAHTYSIIGFEYADLGNTIKALENYNKSLNISEKDMSKESISNTIYTLSYLIQLNIEIKDYNAASELIERTTILSKTINDQRMLANLLELRSTISYRQGNYEAALVTNLEAVKVAKLAVNKIAYGNALASIGWVYIKLGELDSAELNLTKSLEYFRENKNNIAYALAGLAFVANEREDFDKAEELGLEVLKISNNEARIREACKRLKKVYLHKRDFDNYVKYAEKYLEYYKLAHNDESYGATIKQGIQFQFEKQKEIDDLENKQRLELAEQEKKRIRMGMFFAFIIAGLIALVSLYFFKQKKELDNAYEQLEESKKNELAVSNLKALQSQMNPHFIFNALNSVQDLVLLKDIRNSNKYLGKFSDLIRKILLSSKEQFITLEEELEILTLYLDLEKLRFGDDFIIDLQSNVSELKQDEIKLPAMFIQPYIENAIKHGLFHKEGKKELLVHFNIITNALECIIKDNGIGQKKAEEFKQKRLHLHTGFSTEAINERIRLLNETLDKKIELTIEDLYEDKKAVGTKITLLFPV